MIQIYILMAVSTVLGADPMSDGIYFLEESIAGQKHATRKAFELSDIANVTTNSKKTVTFIALNRCALSFFEQNRIAFIGRNFGLILSGKIRATWIYDWQYVYEVYKKNILKRMDTQECSTRCDGFSVFEPFDKLAEQLKTFQKDPETCSDRKQIHPRDYSIRSSKLSIWVEGKEVVPSSGIATITILPNYIERDKGHLIEAYQVFGDVTPQYVETLKSIVNMNKQLIVKKDGRVVHTLHDAKGFRLQSLETYRALLMNNKPLKSAEARKLLETLQ